MRESTCRVENSLGMAHAEACFRNVATGEGGHTQGAISKDQFLGVCDCEGWVLRFLCKATSGFVFHFIRNESV